MTAEWNWDVSVSIFPASPPKIGTLPGFIVCQVYLNPDFAVGVDRKREAQSFRSKVDKFVPLRIHRSALL
jgi:hypothetical protein